MCYVPRGLTWHDSLSVVAEGHFACIHGGVVQHTLSECEEQGPVAVFEESCACGDNKGVRAGDGERQNV